MAELLDLFGLKLGLWVVELELLRAFGITPVKILCSIRGYQILCFSCPSLSVKAESLFDFTSAHDFRTTS